MMLTMNASSLKKFVWVTGLLLAGSISADPLFESRDLFEMSLAADFKTMFKEKDKSKKYPAKFVYPGSDGAVDVELEVRGNFRLQNCQVPGLRIIFPKKPKEGLFAQQKKLKLVAQCRKKGDMWQDYLIQEYTTYRGYEVLTDNSFRARLVKSTFVDTGDNDESWINYAFFIEDKGRMAKRLDMKEVKDNRVSRSDLSPAEANLAVMYQFLVANTDFSLLKGEGDEPCCHNAKLLDPGGKLVPVPYDFDLSGIINTRYAAPPISLGIKKVTQRLYRGFCDNNDVVPDTLAHMIAKKDDVYAAFMDERIREKTLAKMRKFLDRFYEIAVDQKTIDRHIIGKCR
jgi:hypothetical protein